MTITIYTKMTLFSNCPNSSSKFLFSLLNIYFFKFSLYKSSTVIHQAIYQTINKSKKYLKYIDIYLSPVLSTVPHLLQEKHLVWNTAPPALVTNSFAGIAWPQPEHAPPFPYNLQLEIKYSQSLEVTKKTNKQKKCWKTNRCWN